jgi:phospholipid/cholesterol/gamma-HCH transport system substrate-binding protein
MAPFATDGARLLQVLDEQETAVHELIRNTGQVFEAINEREGALRQLIVNSNNTFEATASRDEALAETFRIFPVFLDESKVTLARLEDFSRDTRPLVNDLKAPADDLAPTVRDLGDLAPDLENLFRDLPPLIAASRRSVPEMERVLEEAEPLFEQMHPFFEELNPILSNFNFHQSTLAGFISNAAPDLSGDFGGDRYQVNVGIIEPTGFVRHLKRPDSERGNAYMQPNALQRAIALGTIESFNCPGGEKPMAEDAEGSNPLQKEGQKRPPCLVAPSSMYNGKQFVGLESGQAPFRRAPGFREGNSPAVDPNPADPHD